MNNRVRPSQMINTKKTHLPGKFTAATWKSPVWKGNYSSKPAFLGSIFVFSNLTFVADYCLIAHGFQPDSEVYDTIGS